MLMRILQNVTQELTKAHVAVHSPHEVKDTRKNECQRSKVHVLCVQNADITVIRATYSNTDIQSDTKKRELLKNPTKIEEIQEKKIY